MTYLDRIIADTRGEVAERKRTESLEALRRKVEAPSGSRGFERALRTPQPSIIAEFKRRSPSAGTIGAGELVPVSRAFERGGAAAISVLTEGSWFGGCLKDLVTARASIALPVLRKDFIIDEYQLFESAAAGADAVLLIVAALTAEQLGEYLALAGELGMDALVEVHDEAEAERALGAGARMVGVNNRDLRTLAVDRSTAARVCRRLPTGCLVVAESGYPDDRSLVGLAEHGIAAVLIGEALLRSEDPEEAVRAMCDALQDGAYGGRRKSPAPGASNGTARLGLS